LIIPLMFCFFVVQLLWPVCCNQWDLSKSCPHLEEILSSLKRHTCVCVCVFVCGWTEEQQATHVSMYVNGHRLIIGNLMRDSLRLKPYRKYLTSGSPKVLLPVVLGPQDRKPSLQLEPYSKSEQLRPTCCCL